MSNEFMQSNPDWKEADAYGMLTAVDRVKERAVIDEVDAERYPVDVGEEIKELRMRAGGVRGDYELYSQHGTRRVSPRSSVPGRRSEICSGTRRAERYATADSPHDEPLDLP